MSLSLLFDRRAFAKGGPGGIEPPPQPSPRTPRGFTLIELLVVMAIIGVLLSIAAPRYFNHVEKAREGALRQSLAVMRDAIDKFYADTERYPESLAELTDKRYLRSIPEDPFTGTREDWAIEAPPDGDTGVFDVHSAAIGNASNGTPLGAL